MGEGSEDSDSVDGGEVVEEFVVLELDIDEKKFPSFPRPIELGICAGCAGNFAGSSCSLEFIQEIIVGGSRLMRKFFGI